MVASTIVPFLVIACSLTLRCPVKFRECSLCHATDSISFRQQQHLSKRRERAVSNKTSRKRGFAAFPYEKFARMIDAHWVGIAA